MPIRRAAIALVLCLFAQSARAADSGVVAEVRALMKDGQYPAALQRIAQALSLKGPAAAGVAKYELLMLKGECHLSTKQANLAIESFDGAAKAATSDEQQAIAAAHTLLIKRSQQLAYKPRVAPGKPPVGPIDIVDAESRTKAMAALFADELAATEPKVKAAAKATALPPVLEGLKLVTPVMGLELAATQDAPKSRELVKGLADHTRKLLAAAVADANKRVAAIDKEAGTFVEFWYDAYVPVGFTAKTRRERAWKRKGLNDAELRELQVLAATCDRIPPAIETLAQALKSEGKDLSQFADDAGRTRKEIARVLDTDYQQVFHKDPTKK